MKMKVFSCMIIGMLCAASIAAYRIELPQDVIKHSSVEVMLVPEPGDPEIRDARFYIITEEQKLMYLELKQVEGTWRGVLPGSVVSQDQLSHFVEYMGRDGVIYRLPDTGLLSVEVLEDTVPPLMTQLRPTADELQAGVPNIMLFTAAEKETIARAEVRINRRVVDEVQIAGNVIRFVHTPMRLDTQVVEITATDDSGNIAVSEFSFTVVGELKQPFVWFASDLASKLDISYSMETSQDGHEIPGDLLSDSEHSVELGYLLSAVGSMHVGPLFTAQGGASLTDSREVLTYIDVYPSTLISDVRDILRLWHPYNFDNEFTFTESDVRMYPNNNEYYAHFNFFWDSISYRFGDQHISFQDQTVRNLSFRGTSVTVDLPLIYLKVGKGLTDLGQKETAWPRNFVGIQAGLNLLDYFWLQTNVSIISDFQGRFNQIGSTGKSDIGMLFGLAEDDVDLGYQVFVPPEQNIIFGLGTGISTPWATVSAEAGLTLYVDDAGDLLNIEGLVSFLEDNDVEVGDYTQYIDTVQDIFPVLDYFPLNLGIGMAFLDKNLWGITYGADVEVPPFGLTLSYRKTDSTYQSLGASVSTNNQELGAQIQRSFGSWRTSLGYRMTKDNISDIVTHDILPLFLSQDSDIYGYLADTSPPQVSAVKHQGDFKVQTPNIGPFGRLTWDYRLVWDTSNFEALELDTDEAKDRHNESLTHTAGVVWRSSNYQLFGTSWNFTGKAKAAYKDNLIVKGESDPENFGTVPDSFWDFNAGAGFVFRSGNLRISPEYQIDFSTKEDSAVKHTTASRFSVSDVWFDSMGLSLRWIETVSPSGQWLERSVGGTLGLAKTFGIVSTGLDLSAGMTFSENGDSDDTTLGLKLFGGISL